MSKYDPVLRKDYLKEITDNRRFFSPQIQNKFTLETTWRKIYWIEFEKPIIFGVILDSTPDISHADQTSFICWYVIVEEKEVEVRKSFLGFITEHRKTAYDMKKMNLNRLEKEKLDFKEYREIGFSNAACMARVHGGVQCLLRNINEKTKFVPCSSHNLNLCGVHASAMNASAITFFGGD